MLWDNYKIIRPLSVLLCLFVLEGCSSLSDDDEIKELFFQPIIDSKILILSNREIVYSSNYLDGYNLYKIDQSKRVTQFSNQPNCFSPFFSNNKIYCLRDKDGNEEYQIYSPENNMFFQLKNRYIIRIYSDRTGQHFIAIFKDDNAIYLYDSILNEPIIIGEYKEKVNDIHFCSDSNLIIMSMDKELVIYDSDTHKKLKISSRLLGEKLNPFYYKGIIYFISNAFTKYYRIYNYDIQNDALSIISADSNNCDYLLPKRSGDNLYYITVKRNEYLLNTYNLVSKSLEQVTSSGVIYNYYFLDESKLILIYSDIYSPKSIFEISLENGNLINLLGTNIKHDIQFTYIERTEKLSPAYRITKKESYDDRAIIYLHPGLNSDFSPRWDNLLYSLVYSGYTIFAPNYPMSFGYGKDYQNSSIEIAIGDILNWIENLIPRFKKIYLLSLSSGNLIMESILNSQNQHVSSTATIAGLSCDYTTEYLKIYGINDPLLNENKLLLEKIKNNRYIFLFYDEGHWLRKRRNQRIAFRLIKEWFN